MKSPYQVLLALIIIHSAICAPSRAQSSRDSSAPAPVLLSVTVTDNRKEAVVGLPQSAFTISDDTGPREITSFTDKDEPVSIALLIDVSGSIRSVSIQKRMSSIVDALSHFIHKSHPSNEYFVFAFNNKPYFLLKAAGATAALSALQKLASAEIAGNTAFYDACVAGIEMVRGGIYRKRIIILLSDGRDNSSQHTFDDVRRLLKLSDALVYSVDVSPDRVTDALDPLNVEGSQILDDFASLTGGTKHSPSNPIETKADLELIAVVLRQQYSIGILPAKDTSSGKWHPLKIKVSLPANASKGLQKLSARSRKGYFSTLISR